MQGAAYEIVQESRLDLAAWVGWLAEQGYGRIALMGHSLGAVKAIYSLSHDDDGALAAVVCLLAISPPRLAYSQFCAGPRAAEFQTELAEAEGHLREGRGETLMSVRFPLPYLVTAAGYVDKYGPAERYNLLKFASRVACPALYTFGSLEVQQNAAFQGLPEQLEDAGLAGSRSEGGGHYRGRSFLFGRLRRLGRSAGVLAPSHDRVEAARLNRGGRGDRERASPCGVAI